MTAAQVTALAQQNPVRTLTTRLGELKEQADREILNLTMTLKQIDATRDMLAGHGITMTVDLGPIGNSAANARRAMLDDEDARTFALPKAV